MKLIYWLLSSITLTILVSCSTGNNDSEKLNSFFERSSQKFNLDNHDSIAGQKGTVIIIDKNSFEFENGQPVTGAVTVELEEYYKKSEILLTNLSTVSGDKLLETAGMINLLAFSENQKLKLKKGKSATIKFPYSKLKKGMKIFNGELRNGTINWVYNKPVIMSKAGFFQQEPDSTNTELFNNANYYLLKSTKLGWINCDRFYELDDKTNISVKCDTAQQPIISMVFKEINSILPGRYYKGKYNFQNVPIGYIVNLIALKKNKNSFFYAEKTVEIEPNLTIDLEFNEIKESELMNKLDKLNNQ